MTMAQDLITREQQVLVLGSIYQGSTHFGVTLFLRLHVAIFSETRKFSSFFSSLTKGDGHFIVTMEWVFRPQPGGWRFHFSFWKEATGGKGQGSLVLFPLSRDRHLRGGAAHHL